MVSFPGNKISIPILIIGIAIAAVLTIEGQTPNYSIMEGGATQWFFANKILNVTNAQIRVNEQTTKALAAVPYQQLTNLVALKMDSTVSNVPASFAGVYTNAQIYVDHIGRVTNIVSLAEPGGGGGGAGAPVYTNAIIRLTRSADQTSITTGSWQPWKNNVISYVNQTNGVFHYVSATGVVTNLIAGKYAMAGYCQPANSSSAGHYAFMGVETNGVLAARIGGERSTASSLYSGLNGAPIILDLLINTAIEPSVLFQSTTSVSGTDEERIWFQIWKIQE